MQQQVRKNRILVATPLISPEVTSFYCDGLMDMYLRPPQHTTFSRLMLSHETSCAHEAGSCASSLSKKNLPTSCTSMVTTFRAQKPCKACSKPTKT